MPFHVPDYLSATIGLTHAQHGSYILALSAYWIKGESLTSPELREVCGREVDRVQQFFVWEGSRWHHVALDRYLSVARDRKQRSLERASNAAKARWSKQ